jgi:hypothetical protein
MLWLTLSGLAFLAPLDFGCLPGTYRESPTHEKSETPLQRSSGSCALRAPQNSGFMMGLRRGHDDVIVGFPSGEEGAHLVIVSQVNDAPSASSLSMTSTSSILVRLSFRFQATQVFTPDFSDRRLGRGHEEGGVGFREKPQGLHMNSGLPFLLF